MFLIQNFAILINFRLCACAKDVMYLIRNGKLSFDLLHSSIIVENY